MLTYDMIDNRKKKRDFFDSVKDISDTFLNNTKKFIENKLKRINDRVRCSCEMGLKNHETCSVAY